MKQYQVALALQGWITAVQCLDCTSDEDCISDYGTSSRCRFRNPCNTGECACIINYARYDGNCSEVSDLGATCSSGSDAQCGSGAECDSNACACKSGYTSSGSKHCRANADVGEACSDSDVCIARFGDCVNNVCNCSDGWRQSGSRCLPVDRGEACSTDSDCAAFLSLTCENNVCSCASDDLLERSVNNLGINFRMCLNQAGQVNRARGETCSNDVTPEDASYSLCRSPLECDTCPGSSNHICMDSSGASVVLADLLLLLPLVTMAM